MNFTLLPLIKLTQSMINTALLINLPVTDFISFHFHLSYHFDRALIVYMLSDLMLTVVSGKLAVSSNISFTANSSAYWLVLTGTGSALSSRPHYSPLT